MSFAPLPPDRLTAAQMPFQENHGLSWKSSMIGTGLAVVVPLLVSVAPVIAEKTLPTPSPSSVPTSSVPKANAATVLVVNPTSGNDATADGSDRAPFKTITQALQVAQTGTVIRLASGTYNEATGEKFPLYLKPGVILQGNSQNRGSDVVIQGSGFILSPTFARQNVTIVGASKAALVGVTVTNSHPQGYGLWVESTSLTVTDSTFTASGHDGISVVGDSSPLIRNNYFAQNGANGITVYGSSRPEIRENVFEQNGFAINLNQTAAPLIIGNRITQNKDGVVTQASSHPTLRNNSIEGNERDGVVAIAQSRPDLGTASEPGGNFIRNNGQFDINTQATSQSIPAFGNELDQTSGPLDLAGTNSPAAAVATAVPDSTSTAPDSLPTVSVTARSSQQLQRATAIAATTVSPATPAKVAVSPAVPTAASNPTPVAEKQAPTTDSAFPVPAALTGSPDSTQSPRPFQLVRLASSTAVAATPSSGISASPLVREQPSPSTSIFPTPALLTTPPSDRVAIVPNSPPVSLALPISEASPDLLNPGKSQAAALGAVPVQVRLPNFERKAAPVAPPTIPTVVPEKPPKVTPPIAPPAPEKVSALPVLIPAKPDPKPARISRVVEIPVPAPEIRSVTPAPENRPQSETRSSATRSAIEIPVPVPEIRSVVPRPEILSNPVPQPVASSPPLQPPVIENPARSGAVSLLPVPDANAPIGNAGSRAKATATSAGAQGDTFSPPAPPDRGDLVGVRYRVLVEADNDSQQAQIRSLVPTAFPTSSQGRSVMQVGAFGDRGKADQLVQSLVSQGLKATIEPME